MGVSVFLGLCLVLAVVPWTPLVQSASDESPTVFNVTNGTLDATLKKVLNISSNSSVQINLSSGQFLLSSNQLAIFSNWTSLAIVGEDREVSVIKCVNGVGLTFHNCVDIAIRNVTISGCGTNQTSTSRITGGHLSTEEYLSFSVALYFLACANITMEHATVSESTWTGVAIYNTGGINNFVDCQFTTNYASEGNHSGGGMVVEFSYCVPGDTSCNDTASSVHVVGSTYLFRRCHFEDNVASLGALPRETLYPHGTEHMAFGKGGALSVHFKGRSKGNTILLDDCDIVGNAASSSGGGLYFGFGDQSLSNSVRLQGEKLNLVRNNMCSCKSDPSPCTTAGGGVRIEFIHYPSEPQLWTGYISNVVNNSVVFSGTYISNNIAHVGGGVSLSTSREEAGHQATNSLMFEKSHFLHNLAFLGSAVDLSLQRADITTDTGAVMEPIFKSCEFERNAQNITNVTHYRESSGALYANQVPAVFEGVTTFAANPGSAMVVSETHVSLMNSSSMNFTNNAGRRGGALAFIGNAWLTAYEDTDLIFDGNSVGMEGLGGAIYAVHFGEHDLISQRNCFIRYYKPLEHPSKWNAKIAFVRNTAKFARNSIFVSSVLPCAWPKVNSSEVSLSETFCGHPWVFEDSDHSDCRTQVATGPSVMTISNITLHAVPGWEVDVGISVRNDYNISIPAILRAVPAKMSDSKIARVSKKTEYIADNKMIAYGKPKQDSKVHFLFTTLDPRVITSRTLIVLSPCPPGFRPDYCNDSSSAGMICDCKCAGLGSGVKCHDETHTARLMSHNCLTRRFDENGTIDNSSHLIFGQCPYNRKKEIHLHNISDLEKGVCGDLNRNGTLCSKCIDGYGVDVNSYNFRCRKCHVETGWLLYLVLEILPITLFFMFIAILHISATSAPMNAFVFFSQIVSIPYFNNPYPFFFSSYFLSEKWLRASVLVPYGIWNLNFFTSSVFPGVCLSTKIGTMDAFALNYVKALYPMLLILVCYMLIRLYDYNVRVVRWMWMPFRWCLKRLHKRHEPRTSIIDAFATFLLLSYTKFMFVSFPLLTPQPLYNGSAVEQTQLGEVVFYFDASVQFSGKYLVLGIVAAILIFIFVILPPLLLIAYPTRLFQRCIGRLPFRIVIKTFADAFQGDFRNGIEQGMDCRCFSGLYFIFRIVIFVIFVIPLDWAAQYLIQQIFFTVCIILFTMVKPYREEIYNKIDISFFFLLSLMNAFSFYSSQVYENHGDKAVGVFVVNYILGLLPLLYITVLVSYLILLWVGCLKKPVESKPSESIVIIGESGFEDDSDEPFLYTYNPQDPQEDIPDRLLNPQNYASRNLYRAPSSGSNPTGQGSTSGSNSQASNKEIISEGSYFLEKKAKKEFSAYGSTSVTEPPVRFKGHTQLQEFPEET